MGFHVIPVILNGSEGSLAGDQRIGRLFRSPNITRFAIARLILFAGEL